MHDPLNMTVENLAAQLHAGRDGILTRLFLSNGRRKPEIYWSPDLNAIRNPLLARFNAIRLSLSNADGRLPHDRFDIDHFRGLQDWLMVLDVENAGLDFRYSFYGDGIADMRGVSLHGTTVKDLNDYVGNFFAAVYRTVVSRKEPVLTLHEPPKSVFARSWERLIVPLFQADGTISNLIALNVPDNELRPGLEIVPDPILIADENQIVRYANRAAQETFGHQIYLGADMDLFTFAGIDMDMPASARELARTKTVRDAVSLVISGRMIERFQLTISGTIQWGNPYYVITLRPAIDQD